MPIPAHGFRNHEFTRCLSKASRIALLSAIGALVTFAGFDLPAHAQSATWYSGEITWLELWRSGNVSFTLSATGVPCNGQFILNRSEAGTKNQYAALIAAKLAGRTVSVYFDACGPAEGYGADFAQVAYLRPN
jgi:hypothetical protein